MFNATNAKAAAAARLEELTDRFAAEWEDRSLDLTMTEKEELMQRLLAVLANPNATTAFVAGQYAQQSNGQPAAALGAGSPTQQPADETAALGVLMASPLVDSGVKQALRRLLNPNDPQPILVEADGTPSELVATRRERDDAKRERDTARTELADERNDTKSGSLAKQLADATAAAATSDDLVRKDVVLPLIAAVENAAGDLDTGMMTSQISGLPELDQAITDAKAAVS